MDETTRWVFQKCSTDDEADRNLRLVNVISKQGVSSACELIGIEGLENVLQGGNDVRKSHTIEALSGKIRWLLRRFYSSRF